MVIAGPILVGAPPARPMTEQGSRGGSRPDEASQEMTRFGGGQGDEWGGGRRLRWGRRMRAILDTEADQEDVGEQDQGQMAIPAQVTAHFILIESQVFGGLQVLFDVPAAANGLDHDGQRRGRRRKDEIRGDLAGIVEAATKDEEVTVVDGALMHNGQDGPGKQTLAFGTQALGEGLPVRWAERLLMNGGGIGA